MEADKMTIAEFLHQNMDDTDRAYAKPLIDLFMSVLKKLKLELFSFNW